ncbi:MAG TPA: hypothetical protein VGM31_02850, partial [Puia sp.]
MSLRGLLLFILLGECLTGLAQVAAAPGYRIERFTTDNGLPSDGIKGLQWDETTGFLWVATEAGVTRYNGADFLNFSKANTPRIISERMLFLFKNRAGRIYTSDEMGNIFFVMQNRLQYLGQVKLDARPSAFKLVGLAASGKMFRQSADHPISHFGFNFQNETMIPLDESRIILFHKDTIYDYQAGRLEPVPKTALAAGSKVFYMDGRLFVFSPGPKAYQLNRDSFTMQPVKWDIGQDGQLLWASGMKHPILIAGHNAWLLSYAGNQLTGRLICNAVPTDALLSF